MGEVSAWLSPFCLDGLTLVQKRHQTLVVGEHGGACFAVVLGFGANPFVEKFVERVFDISHIVGRKECVDGFGGTDCALCLRL